MSRLRTINTVETEKFCSKCKSWKNTDDFYKHAKSPDGFEYSCKDCKLAYLKARNNPVIDGPKTCRDCGVTYEDGKESFYRNKGKKDGLQDDCKTCRSASNKAWAEGNPISVAVATANRVARDVYELDERLTVQEVQSLFDLWGHKCEYCGGDGRLGLDHVIPFSRGGSNTIYNVVPCCPSCNFAKGDKTPEEYEDYLKNKEI
jgi:hypothetical protein